MSCALFGAPGAGKGTQSALLVERKNMHHISTGDLFRNAIKNETPLGIKAKSFMDKGNLVPDDVVIGLVEEVFKGLSGRQFILDGFPRTVAQAEALEEILKKNSLELDTAIFLDVPKDKIVDRLSGRRVCKNCGTVFHVVHQPPAQAGVCDNCGQKALYQREDDKESVIGVRLDNYEKSTAPLRQYFRDKGIFRGVDGDGSAEQVFERLEKLI